jgi:preprotein translocase subunit SecB
MLRLRDAPATRPLDRRPAPQPFSKVDQIMAEDEGAADISELAGNGNDSLPQVGVLAQYVKDLSFENPNAPAVYQWQSQPQMDVQFNIGTQPAGTDIHEVSLKIDITAKADEGTAFRIELLYAGLFALRNIPAEQLQPFLLAEAPRMLFPFARKIIADAAVEGGFPPLRLDPIDFAGLYMQSAAQQAADATGGQAGDVTGQA